MRSNPLPSETVSNPNPTIPGPASAPHPGSTNPQFPGTPVGPFPTEDTGEGNINSPVITSSGTEVGKVGKPFVFRLQAANNPSFFTINGKLPDGLSLDSKASEIVGTPKSAGKSDVEVSATNSRGTHKARLVITIS